MFNSTEERAAVLGICVTPTSFVSRSATVDFRAVHSGRRAIDMLRLVHFDLLLVGLKLPDMSAWNFMRHVKTTWPQQKWALVGGPISQQQEIEARMLGVTTLFEAPPAIEEVCNWRTLADVLRTARRMAGDAVSVEVADAVTSTPISAGRRGSKYTSPFEITRSPRGIAARASYARIDDARTV